MLYFVLFHSLFGITYRPASFLEQQNMIGVSGQLHVTAALLCEGTRVPIEQMAGWTREPVWTLWRTENIIMVCSMFCAIIRFYASKIFKKINKCA